MFELGDIVKYKGTSLSEEEGHKLMLDWFPLVTPIFIGVICEKHQIDPIQWKTSEPIIKYSIRVYGFDHHIMEDLYNFEIEKVN